METSSGVYRIQGILKNIELFVLSILTEATEAHSNDLLWEISKGKTEDSAQAK